LAPVKWTSSGFIAGAASVGIAWAILGGRVEQRPSPPRHVTILPYREPSPDAAVLPDRVSVPFEEPAGVNVQVQSPEQEAVAPVAEVIEAVRPEPAVSTDAVLLINVNTASAEELDLLPGIGPALAQRIIDERTRNGRFISVRDLQRVRGIGPKTVEKLEGLVAFE